MRLFTCLFLVLCTLGCVTQVVQPRPDIDLNACVPIIWNNQIIGTGVVIKCVKDEEVYIIDILTAKHVAVNHGLSIVVNKEQNRILQSKLYSLDIAILTCISTSPVAPVKCQFSDPRPLDVVYTVGYPLGISQVVTIGIINQSVTNIAEGGWLCSSPAMPGNSGGGVFNNKGELLGITIAIVMINSNNTEIPVPHLQIFIPISKFSSWLKGEAHV